MDIFFTARSFSHNLRPGFSRLNLSCLDRSMEKTGLTSPTRIILISNLARGMSFSPILIFSIVTTSNPLLRTLTSFSDRPKAGKREMPTLPLIRTSIPRAVDVAASIRGVKPLILSMRTRIPTKTTSVMTPVVMYRTFFLWIDIFQPPCSIRERITLDYFTTRSFFTDVTPLTLCAISTALSTAF